MQQISDIIKGIERWNVWYYMALNDVRSRYKRTILGPFWTVLNVGILVLALGLVYSYLWKVDTAVFLPYFSAGYVSWIFFTSTINESNYALINSEKAIKSTALPYSVHIFRVLARNVIVLAHCLLVHLCVIIYFGIWPNMNMVLLFPLGLFILFMNLLWIAVFLSVICARYRDVSQAVTSVLQVAFFVTPIFWQVKILDDRPEVRLILADLNPVFHYVELVRKPLLGQVPALETYVVTIVIAVIGSMLSLSIFSRYKGRIAFWV